MDKRFLTAFLTPDVWEVCRYKLRPFSVIHQIQLMAIGSPLVTGQVPSPADTVRFLRICESDEVNILEVEPTLWDRIMILRMRFDRDFHVSAVLKIRNYINQYSSSPKAVVMKQGGEETLLDRDSLPEVLMLMGVVMSKMGMPERDALRMSIGKLSWYAITIAVCEGAKIRIISTAEEEAAKDDRQRLIEWERAMAERLRLAMLNGKIPTKTINLHNRTK